MLCIIHGNDLYFRAKEWTSTEDLVWKCNKKNVKEWAGNHYFNIEAIYTCSKQCAESTVAELALWKASHDDICPLKVEDTYIGANHGFNCVDKITASNHGKTEADIGSVWQDQAQQTYCLVKVPDKDTLSFVVFDDKNMADGKMRYGKPEGSLIHVRGAVHKEEVMVENRVGTQLWQCFNHYTAAFLKDGVPCDISQDGVLCGESFAYVTEYDLIYVPAMLQYLMENVGYNTNDSQCSDAITESYLRVTVTYEFHGNGSVSSYHKIKCEREIDVDYIGLLQSMCVAEVPYTYVPDTVYDQLTVHEDNTKHTFDRGNWLSDKKAPYRFYQFADKDATKGMALVYDRQYGQGDNATRRARLKNAGWYHTSKKQYPAFISGCALSKGEQLDGFAARMPLHKYDEDVTGVCWYWLGEDIVLLIDTHCAVDKEISLPAYMDGRKLEVLDRTDNFVIVQEEIIGSKLQIKTDGYGYLVVKLFTK